MFLKSTVSRAAGLIVGGVVFFAASTASASLCNDFISTTWTSTNTFITVSNENASGGFVACATLSGFSGDAVFSDNEASFDYSLQALDHDTLRLRLQSTVEDADDAFLFPGFTLELTGIEWIGEAGFIEDVSLVAGNGDLFAVDGFTADSITLAFDDLSLSAPSAFTPGTVEMVADFDITTSHAVPEPGMLAVFAFGLAGLGVARRLRFS